MGDIADMMEEGILCQQCGVYIEDADQTGTWTTCVDCRGGWKNKPKRRKHPSVPSAGLGAASEPKK